MLLALALLVMVNDYRAEYDLPPLLPSAHLTEAAQWMAEDMFGHIDSLGRGPFERMGDYGFGSDRRAENVAMGSDDPARILDGWRNSPAHNRNLLDAEFTVAGIGTSDGFWVMDLGGCRSCRVYPQWRW